MTHLYIAQTEIGSYTVRAIGATATAAKTLLNAEIKNSKEWIQRDAGTDDITVHKIRAGHIYLDDCFDEQHRA